MEQGEGREGKSMKSDEGKGRKCGREGIGWKGRGRERGEGGRKVHVHL